MSYQKPLLSGLATGDPVTYPIYYDQETTTYVQRSRFKGESRSPKIRTAWKRLQQSEVEK